MEVLQLLTYMNAGEELKRVCYAPYQQELWTKYDRNSAIVSPEYSALPRKEKAKNGKII